MGWFDDDSDDSDAGKKKRKLAFETFDDVVVSSAPPTVGDLKPSEEETPCSKMCQTEVKDDSLVEARKIDGASMPQSKPEDTAEDEEDALDSFMKNLSSKNQQHDSKHSNQSHERDKSPQKSSRLDMDNEEEATSHWHVSSTKQPSAASVKESQKEKDEKDRTIDPLPAIDHSTIKYNSFQKKFHSPKSTDQGYRYRQEHDISCTLETIDPISSFDAYPTHIFPSSIQTFLKKQNYHQATPVQAQAIPITLSGHDLIVTSSTGSGKTLSYILPLIPHILEQPTLQKEEGPIALVLVPTRELAQQVYIVSKKLLAQEKIKTLSMMGGSTGTYQLTQELKKGQEVIISTPGRFMDMVKRKHISCQRITYVVLDECDKMLDFGFYPQIESILIQIRPDKQFIMVSATFGKKVANVAQKWCSNAVRLEIGTTGQSSEFVQQHVMVLPHKDAKVQWLLEMLPVLEKIGKMIIFVASRVECDAVAQLIRNHHGTSISVDCIHGDRHQKDRNAAMRALRKGTISALVATDVAARGLDVSDIMTVVNFDPAKNLDSHVHRVGRAGRLNRSNNGNQQKGTSYTLLTSRDADFANTLVKAFQREGREIADDVLSLAQRSKRYHSSQGSKRVEHRGDKNSRKKDTSNYYGPSEGVSGPIESMSSASMSNDSNYYGPSSSSATATTKRKKSRWK
ncbi:hypothetical protein CTEN210_13319 [Chaetoceros tenuissimus]|uniref:RNA helicase n=1 Tax=Chaetoceros tenuissimus TaxID=426638 RepID=A0AAD3D335_9STRA|nr:hypothetical protein CTEN210_13319 [Chaetoceros tenuissimus]